MPSAGAGRLDAMHWLGTEGRGRDPKRADVGSRVRYGSKEEEIPNWGVKDWCVAAEPELVGRVEEREGALPGCGTGSGLLARDEKYVETSEACSD